MSLALRWCLSATGVLTLLVSFAACSPSVRTPSLTAHPRRAFLEVPYPPPAALVETVPPVQNDGAIWVDGYWNWATRYYVWQRGGWLVPPEGGRLAPWISRYTRSGQLLFANSRWYDDAGRELPEPELLVPATTPPNEITEEFQAPR